MRAVLVVVSIMAAGGVAAARPPQAPAPPQAPELAPLTYAEAYRLALASGRPLLVWVGGNFCPN